MSNASIEHALAIDADTTIRVKQNRPRTRPEHWLVIRRAGTLRLAVH